MTRPNGRPPQDVSRSDIDLGSWDFWQSDDDFRDGAFATLRREETISFHAELVVPGFPPGKGHWALTRWDDVHHASRHSELFSSRPISGSMQDMPPEIAEYLGSMINLDDPRHARLGSLVNRAFTPRMIARVEQSVRDRARGLIAEMVDNHPDGECEFVSEFAGPFPLQIICDMMGIPEGDHQKIIDWTAASPIGFMRRTLTHDVELGGIGMEAGDKVTMWYCSANRDDSKFADPWTFDVCRAPNPHVGFGGGGVHFCLGANLARREISVAFDELRRQVPDIAVVAEPDIVHSPLTHGVKTMPVAWTPR